MKKFSLAAEATEVPSHRTLSFGGLQIQSSPRAFKWEFSIPKNSPGVAWDGLVSVTQKSDDSPSTVYIDGQLVRTSLTPSYFSGTIEAFTYPDEFEQHIGIVNGMTGQPKAPFGFCYRNNNEIHLVYSALAAPSNDQYETVGDQINPVTFS